MPYKDYEYVSSAQREINKFNDYIDELVFEYSDNNINNREFKKFYNEVLKDFNSKEHTVYLLDEFSEGIDDSQIFKNRDILKNIVLMNIRCMILVYVFKNILLVIQNL